MESTEAEIWKPNPEFPGFEFSSLGRVRGPNGIRHTWITKHGYENTSLKDKYRLRPFGVHRAVLGAFVPCTDPKMHVDHINNIRHDNRIENLQWVTVAENNRLANLRRKFGPDVKLADHPKRVARRRPGKRNKKFSLEQILKVKKLRETGLSYPKIARLTGVGPSTVRDVCQGIKWRDV